MRTYTVILTPEPEAGGYSVSVPALPGAFTRGETVEDALENAADVVRAMLENMEKHGEVAPIESAPPILESVSV